MRTQRQARCPEGYLPGPLLDWRRTIDVSLCDPQIFLRPKIGNAQSAATLGTAAIADGELIAGIGRKQPGDKPEPVGEGLRREKRILAFAQFRVVEVHCERKLVDGDGVREGRFEEAVSRLLIDQRLPVNLVRLSAVRERQAAALPGVL